MRNKRLHLIVIIIFVIIIGLSLYYVLTKGMNLGLDLQGGTQIILRPTEAEGKKVSSEALDKATLIIMDRIDRLGISEPLVTRDLSNNIVIQLPGVDDPDRAIEVIGKTAQLEFRILKGMLLARKNQASEFVTFDPATGKLDYPADSDEVLLVENMSSASSSIIGKIISDENTGTLYLVKPEYEDEKSPEDVAEDIDDPAGNSSKLNKEDILGKFEYNSNSRELNIVDAATGDIIGEVLIDSRTGYAAIVEPVLITGDLLSKASAGYDGSGKIVVQLSFKSEGAGLFEEVTSMNIGRQLAIVLDEEIKSAPFINVAISGGDAVIEGIDSLEEAKDISLVLQTGALPVNLGIEESSTVGPTLGKDALEKGLIAGIIGLALVMVFMIAIYRGLGFISSISLLIYGIIFLGILSGLGAALTLPGIAGIVLTIGMSVDSYVIIFERIKEERIKGKSTRISISDGFKNGLRAILDSNITNLITAAALYRFGTGPIRGFAVTLSIGILLSMVMSLVFTRAILFLISDFQRILTPGFFGISKHINKE